jgi:hypothetical protein
MSAFFVQQKLVEVGCDVEIESIQSHIRTNRINDFWQGRIHPLWIDCHQLTVNLPRFANVDIDYGGCAFTERSLGCDFH